MTHYKIEALKTFNQVDLYNFEKEEQLNVFNIVKDCDTDKINNITNCLKKNKAILPHLGADKAMLEKFISLNSTEEMEGLLKARYVISLNQATTTITAINSQTSSQFNKINKVGYDK